METKYFLFEDEKVENFLPLVWLNPFVNLRIGIKTIFEKWAKVLDSLDGLIVRPFLAEYTSSILSSAYVNFLPNNTRVVLINARVNPYCSSVKDLLKVPEGWGVKDHSGNVLSFSIFLPEAEIKSCDYYDLAKYVKNWYEVEDIEIMDGLQDLIMQNSKYISEDFSRFYSRFSVRIPPDLRIFGDMVFIHDDAEICPYVVIDATEGPVVVEQNARVLPFVFIKGPAFIGEGTTIKPHAKILENTSIGPICKVGGEVEGSIFHSYANKQHDGFLGHSYIASWVNLGADTVTSDLKNNYSLIRLKYKEREWSSNSKFIGSFIADHVKTGINTMLNSGTIIGVFSNVFGANYPPKFIPSFYWGGADGWEVHNLKRALETAERMMARRKVTLTEEFKKLTCKVFELTEDERRNFGG